MIVALLTINNRFTAAGTVPEFLSVGRPVTGFPLSEKFATNNCKVRKVLGLTVSLFYD
jgi:hypothetical protein